MRMNLQRRKWLFSSSQMARSRKDGDPDNVPSLRTLRFRDRAPSSPAALSKAGVKFAFTSEGISLRRHREGSQEIRGSGLAPDAAVRALTLSPANFCVADRTGSIEKGKSQIC